MPQSKLKGLAPLGLVILAAVIFFAYMVWAPHENFRLLPDLADRIVFFVAFSIPFLLLGYAVWYWTRWPKSKPEERQEGTKASLTGSILAAASAVLLILLQPMIDTAFHVYSRESLSGGVNLQGLEANWVWAGVLMAIIGVVFGIAGAPRLRRPAVCSLILLPIWGYIALGLLV